MKLNILFEKLKLRPNKIEFLEEFNIIMSPLATSLDVTRGKSDFSRFGSTHTYCIKRKAKFTHLSFYKSLVVEMIFSLEIQFKYI